MDGRGPNGRFAKGWRGGPGNPQGRRAQAFRAEMYRAVTRADMREVIAKQVEKAKAGDTQAANFVYDRLLGKPASADLLERIEALEAKFAAEGRLS